MLPVLQRLGDVSLLNSQFTPFDATQLDGRELSCVGQCELAISFPFSVKNKTGGRYIHGPYID